MKKPLRTALIYSATIIVTVVTINLLTSPGFLWCIYPVFGILWWPLSVYFAGRKQPFAFSLCGTALLAGLFFLTWQMASPGAHPWFLYPVLGIIWWPLSVYFSKRKQPLLFAVLGFIVSSALFILLYLFATPAAHPWFLYPVLGMLWWPLSVWGNRKGAKAFSVAGSLLVIATVLTLNLLTSPGFLWCIYPAFFVLWWPVSVLLGKRAATMAFAVGSAVAASLFLFIMHAVQTPNILPWYLYALLPLFWWPVSKLLHPRISGLQLTLVTGIVFAIYYTGIVALLHGVSSSLSIFLLIAGAWLTYAMGLSKYRSAPVFAAVNAALMMAYFYFVHRFVTPEIHPWYWYTFFPLLWWPVSAALKEKAMQPVPVIACAIAFLGYYGILNYTLTPAVPWILFLSFPAAAAVIGSLCRPRKAWVALSIWMALVGIAWFAAINYVFSPHALWAVYPAFALLWWPLSMLLFGRKAKDEDEETETTN